VEDDESSGGERENPEQLVSVVGPENRVGRDPRRIVICQARQDPGADDREQRQPSPAPKEMGPAASEVPMKMPPGRPLGRSA
jgi:hypothetical protein